MRKPIITSANTRIIQYTIGMDIKVDHRGLGRPTLLTIRAALSSPPPRRHDTRRWHFLSLSKSDITDRKAGNLAAACPKLLDLGMIEAAKWFAPKLEEH